ncbi:uncharacterized mitochondrial protein AtMg00810-like [Carya illinoinensis]|uniref:uncharacterized mitochondrial protein AtMg00810-like n=1 Tax=Carya illinoinensis TaxID=32201 RepID=UPI001C718B9F|nr:uncharacterized mitochondrial protein AtMg00810-like [Carya illinoinensis]
MCLINKEIYGLKQAPRAWFEQLSSWLPSNSAVKIFLLVYVDDIVITASNSSVIDTLIVVMRTAFLVQDLGTLSFFLGLEMDHTSDGLLMSQRKYIKTLLTRSNMLQSKPMSSPMATSLKLSKFDSPNFDDHVLYKSLVRGLQYLNLTCLDISFPIGVVVRMIDDQPVDFAFISATISYNGALRTRKQ